MKRQEVDGEVEEISEDVREKIALGGWDMVALPDGQRKKNEYTPY